MIEDGLILAGGHMVKDTLIIERVGNRVKVKYLYYGSYMVVGSIHSKTFGPRHRKNSKVLGMFEGLKSLLYKPKLVKRKNVG